MKPARKNFPAPQPVTSAVVRKKTVPGENAAQTAAPQETAELVSQERTVLVDSAVFPTATTRVVVRMGVDEFVVFVVREIPVMSKDNVALPSNVATRSADLMRWVAPAGIAVRWVNV